MVESLFDYNAAYLAMCRQMLENKGPSIVRPYLKQPAGDLAFFLDQYTVAEIKQIFETYEKKLPKVQRKANLIAELSEIIKAELADSLADGEQSLYDFLLLFATQPLLPKAELMNQSGLLRFSLIYNIIFQYKDESGTIYCCCPSDLISLVEEYYAASDKQELKKRTVFAHMAHNLIELVGVMHLGEFMRYLCLLLKFYEQGLRQKKVDHSEQLQEQDRDLVARATSYFLGFSYYSHDLQRFDEEDRDKELLVFHATVMDPTLLFNEQKRKDDLDYPHLSCLDLLQPQSTNAQILAGYKQELARAGLLEGLDLEKELWVWYVAEQNDLVDRDFYTEILASQSFATPAQKDHCHMLLRDFQFNIKLWRLQGHSASDLTADADFDNERTYIFDHDELFPANDSMLDQLDIKPEDLQKIRAIVPEQREVSIKVGRNDPCPCGSGKKYKRCCGAN